MNYLLAIVAGAVQGLTEFLPISSTGHLFIFEKIFGISQTEFGLSFDASLHLGTLISVLLFFWKDYLKMLKPKNPLLVKIILGSIPAAVIGLIFEPIIETSFRQVWIVGAALLLFSFVMIAAEKKAALNRKKEELSFGQSLIIGFAQALALIPGISRSGSTISAGLFLKLTREESAKFAFMLSGPIIAAAGFVKLLDVLKGENYSPQEYQFFFLGIFSSAVFGYLTIKYFLKYLSSKTLYPFIYYRIVLGLILIFVSFVLGS